MQVARNLNYAMKAKFWLMKDGAKSEITENKLFFCLRDTKMSFAQVFRCLKQDLDRSKIHKLL